ncbi:TPA: hypothetical protein ACH3X3_005067 [Trebouxia sp. C0006]
MLVWEGRQHDCNHDSQVRNPTVDSLGSCLCSGKQKDWTSAGVQRWCCRSAWQMKGWLWRVASGMGSRMKCCAVCPSWVTPVSWPWRCVW